jgi:hypothetical protein
MPHKTKGRTGWSRHLESTTRSEHPVLMSPRDASSPFEELALSRLRLCRRCLTQEAPAVIMAAPVLAIRAAGDALLRAASTKQRRNPNGLVSNQIQSEPEIKSSNIISCRVRRPQYAIISGGSVMSDGGPQWHGGRYYADARRRVRAWLDGGLLWAVLSQWTVQGGPGFLVSAGQGTI